MIGGVLNVVSVEMWNRVVPLDASPERLRGLMLGYYVGAAVGGVCMFGVGYLGSRRRPLPASAHQERVGA